MDFDLNNPAITEQAAINQAIAEALIEFIPESWLAAELRLEFNVEGGGVSQRVVNPDTGEGWTVSHDLVLAVLQLDGHRHTFGLWWRSAVYCVRLRESGDWDASVSFR